MFSKIIQTFYCLACLDNFVWKTKKIRDENYWRIQYFSYFNKICSHIEITMYKNLTYWAQRYLDNTELSIRYTALQIPATSATPLEKFSKNYFSKITAQKAYIKMCWNALKTTEFSRNSTDWDSNPALWCRTLPPIHCAINSRSSSYLIWFYINKQFRKKMLWKFSAFLIYFHRISALFSAFSRNS